MNKTDTLEADAPAVPQEPVAWQPIETAPKDGSRVLLWWDGAAREGWCAGAGKSRDGGDWWRSHSLTVCAGRPTQWMSLPPAPEGSPQKSPVLTDAEIIQAIEQRFAPAVSAVPVAYLAWRDGKPCWEGDDCVCADAVYPVDHDDDRTSMPVYLAPQQQTATSDEWLANCPQSVRDLANKIKAEMAVPQEPVRNDMSIQLLERLIKTLTNLGYATPEGGIEAFNADLPTQLYHLCFGVDRVLSALKTAVPQEPVAWQYRGRPAVNHEWGEWHTVGYKPKGPECTRFMMRPLFAEPQPQQPRLTDAEILTLWGQTYVERGTSGIEFARSIERKVRGEA